MNSLMDLKIRTVSVDISSVQTDLLALGMFLDQKTLPKTLKSVDQQTCGAIQSFLQLKDIGAEGVRSHVFYGDLHKSNRVLIVSLGKKSDFDLNVLRRAAIEVGTMAITLGIQKMHIAIHMDLPKKYLCQDIGRVVAEGICFGGYLYDEFIISKGTRRPNTLVSSIVAPFGSKLSDFRKGVEKGIVVGQSCNIARTFANRPGNVIYPISLANEARSIVSKNDKLTVTVLDETRLKEMGMGGILAVGSGSVRKPCMIVLQWKPGTRKAQKKPTIGLVGKAVTFDSGGISIKPSANMDQMKLDMSGGAAVLATMQVVARLKLDVNVVGIIPSAENMPGRNSYRPGDIITTYSKKTVEILNTDAEGRMILCDGITYAVEKNCDIIIDIATLTGACMVALGKYMAGVMSNDEYILGEMQKASIHSGEKIWPLPSGDEYAEEMKSKVADLKNTGSRWGGACTAAAFLRQFAEPKKWLHLDIAGMDVLKDSRGNEAGSSGFGVRLLSSFLMRLDES